MSALTKLRDALEERTGLMSALARRAGVTVPGGARWRYVFGAMLMALVGVEFATGVAMMTVYSPGTHTAWASTYYLQYVLPWGGTVRAMHHWASHAMVVLIAAHMLQVVVARGHRGPREVNWWLGLALAALVLGFAMTGFPLAWDQKGYWASRVETGIMGTLPVLGPTIQRAVIGGARYGALTLTRFYTLHVVVLPGLLAAAIGAHVALVRRHGVKAPEGATGEESWWPGQAARDALAGLAAVLVVFWLARSKGVWLDAPADAQSEYPARPEWYFSPLSQLLHTFQGPMQIIGTAVIPGVLTGYLVALPFIDGPSRKGFARVFALLPLGVFAVGGALLGLQLAEHDAGDRGFQEATSNARRRAARSIELARRGIPPEGPLEMLRNDPAVRPRALFAQHCGTCHAVQGVSRQRKAPRLDGFGSRGWAAAFIVWPDHPELMGTTEIHDMSPMRRLSADEVRAAAEWLHAQGVERGEPAADAALVARGAEIVRARCNRCHLGSLTPENAEEMTRDAPSLDGWGSREYIEDQVMGPQRMEQYGARNHMTSFRGKLNERELGMVVDYTRSLRPRTPPEELRPPAPTPRPPSPDETDAGTPP